MTAKKIERMTTEFIDLIKGDECLRTNAIIEAHRPNASIGIRGAMLHKIIRSLAEINTGAPFLVSSMSAILLENIDWDIVINFFEHQDATGLIDNDYWQDDRRLEAEGVAYYEDRLREDSREDGGE